MFIANQFIPNQTDTLTDPKNYSDQNSDQNPNSNSNQTESLQLASPLPTNLPPEPEFSGTVKKILENRYSKPGETWKDIVYRVAHHVSQAEKNELQPYWEQKFFEQIYLQKFSPNSPAYNAGNQKQGLSACFVIEVEDNMPSILNSVYRGGMIGVCGGGYGIDFSPIRPKNFSISGCNSGASGPVSFLGMHDAMAVSVKQGGRRKVAEMANLRVSHLDILDFIDAKATPGVLENMNMSVFVDDEFMHAAEQDQLYRLYYKNVSKHESASMILNRMALRAWETGEPGILFEDRINQDNACPNLGRITATNPCVTGDTWVKTSEGRKQIQNIIGEKVVLIINGEETPTTDEGFFFTGVKPVYRIKTVDGHALKATADHKIMTNSGWKEVRHLDKEDEIFLDNNMTSRFASRRFICPQEPVYDCTVPESHKFVANGMVVHNCSEQPLLPNESCTLGSVNLDKFVDEKGKLDIPALTETIKIAVRFLDDTLDVNIFPDSKIENMTKHTRPIGLGFMGFADILIKMKIRYGSPESKAILEEICKLFKEVTDEYSVELAKEKGAFPGYWDSALYPEYGEDGIRNSRRRSIAPTGTISQIFDCSSGIEPLFQIEPIERTVTGLEGIQIFKNKWTDIYLTTKDPRIKAALITGNEIHWKEHIEIVAVAQKYIDTGISKTISMPNHSTVEDVKEAFLYAWRLGCKGITVYRDGCKRGSLFKKASVSKAIEEAKEEAKPTPKKTLCPEHKIELELQGRCFVCPVCGWTDKCSL